MKAVIFAVFFIVAITNSLQASLDDTGQDSILNTPVVTQCSFSPPEINLEIVLLAEKCPEFHLGMLAIYNSHYEKAETHFHNVQMSDLNPKPLISLAMAISTSGRLLPFTLKRCNAIHDSFLTASAGSDSTQSPSFSGSKDCPSELKPDELGLVKKSMPISEDEKVDFLVPESEGGRYDGGESDATLVSQLWAVKYMSELKLMEIERRMADLRLMSPSGFEGDK